MTKRANGSGSLSKTKQGKWRALASLNGGRLSKTFTTQREASAWLRETINQAERGLEYSASQTRIGSMLDTWLERKAARIRPSTLELYRQILEVHIKPKIGNLRMVEINPARVQAFYDSLLAGGVGKRTIELVHTVLHGGLSHARKIGLAMINAAELVEVPRPEHREMSVWSESQVSLFLAAVNGDPFYKLAFASGMRRGELIGLKWSDLDWKTGMLQVRRQVYEPKSGGWRFQEPKTARGKRGVLLGRGLLESLRTYYNTTLPLMISFAGEAWQENDLIFPNTKGTPRNGYEVTRRFQKQAAAIGLPVIRFHDIRHTCASILLAHGEPPVNVAQLLGQSIPVLLETYAHYIPDNTGRAAAIMDEVTTPAALLLPVVRGLHESANAGEGDFPGVGEAA